MSRDAPRRRSTGCMAEFDDPSELIAAARQARDGGLPAAWTPTRRIPIEELAEALGCTRNRLPLIVLIGGIVGALRAASACSTGPSVIAYPLNVGGRPFNSWPAFIPITFECTVLVAALAAVLGMLALNGLPMPYHPVFNVPRFALAIRDRFFLCIEASDPQFDREATRRFLERLGAAHRWPRLSTERSAAARPRCARVLASLACSRCCCCAAAAARTCTTSRSTSRSSASAFFADGRAVAAAGAGHGRARPACTTTTLFYTGKAGRQARSTRSRSPVTRAAARARPGALQHLLLALPRPDRQRQRHDRAARLSAAAVVPHRAAARGAGRLLLRRDHQRLRRHAELRAAGPGRTTAGRSSPTSARCS